MKNSIIRSFTACVAALVAVSCIDSGIDMPKGEDTGFGTLAISSVGITEDIREKDHVATRAGGNVAVDDFSVRIERISDGTVGYQGLLGEMPSSIELAVGDYSLYVESHEVVPAEWERVHFSLSYTFSITKDNITLLDEEELVCKVSNILVSVRFHENMKRFMEDDCIVTVKIGEGALDYDKDEIQRGAFQDAAADGKNVLVWDFSGTIAGEEYLQSDFIKDVKAGEHRTLTFNTEVIERGDGTFELAVTADCETYDVNLNVTVGEEIIDPFDPTVIISATHSLTDRTTISKSEALVEGVPAIDLGFGIESEAGLASLVIELSTDNVTLSNVLAMQGLGGKINLAETGAAQSMLKDMFGLPIGPEVAGATDLSLDLSGLLSMLFESPIPFGDIDQFDIVIAAIDSNGFDEVATLRLKLVDDTVARPITITGDGIDERKVIARAEFETASVVVDIAAPAGIANFFVQITSNNAAFDLALNSMNDDATNPTITLADEFDLAHPGGLGELLGSLGLPVGDQVLDKTAIPFDISSFIPMMGFLMETDKDFDADFQMRIVDGNGQSETRTLKLRLTE